jgi:hypothetical protein
MTLNEFKKKVTIFGNGCLKHGKSEIGRAYLDLIPVYQEKAMKLFPMIGESS